MEKSELVIKAVPEWRFWADNNLKNQQKFFSTPTIYLNYMTIIAMNGLHFVDRAGVIIDKLSLEVNWLI